LLLEHANEEVCAGICGSVWGANAALTGLMRTQSAGRAVPAWLPRRSVRVATGVMATMVVTPVRPSVSGAVIPRIPRGSGTTLRTHTRHRRR